MKTFKDMWEDAAANSGRKFVERIVARRKAAEAKKEAKNENV